MRFPEKNTQKPSQGGKHRLLGRITMRSRIGINPPGPPDETLFEHRVFTEEIELEGAHLGGSLIQYARRPYKKGEIWTEYRENFM